MHESVGLEAGGDSGAAEVGGGWPVLVRGALGGTDGRRCTSAAKRSVLLLRMRRGCRFSIWL